MEAAHLEGSERSLAPSPGQAVPGASQPGGQHDLQAACAQGGIVWTKNPPPKKTAGEAVTVVSIVLLDWACLFVSLFLEQILIAVYTHLYKHNPPKQRRDLM